MLLKLKLSTLIRSIRRMKLGQVSLLTSSLILTIFGGYLNSNPQAHVNALYDPYAILIDGENGTTAKFRGLAMFFFLFTNILIVLDLQSERFPLSRFMGPFLDSLGCLTFLILAYFQWGSGQTQTEEGLTRVSEILAFHFTLLGVLYGVAVVLGVVFHLTLQTTFGLVSDATQTEKAESKGIPDSDVKQLNKLLMTVTSGHTISSLIGSMVTMKGMKRNKSSS